MNAVPAMLVTLPQARLHLRSVTTADDADVLLKIQAASMLVVEYVDYGMLNFTDTSGAFISPYRDSAGNFVAPSDMVAATLLMLGYLYAQRDEDSANEFADGRLPRPVRALLSSRRSLVT